MGATEEQKEINQSLRVLALGDGRLIVTAIATVPADAKIPWTYRYNFLRPFRFLSRGFALTCPQCGTNSPDYFAAAPDLGKGWMECEGCGMCFYVPPIPLAPLSEEELRALWR